MTQPNPIAELIKAMYVASEGPACDYCDADDELIEYAPGVMMLQILHDNDCPELARRRASARANAHHTRR